ncbi:MAG: peptidylprolyl isomerase [Candidatus Wallbacteria bacterium]
MNIHAAISNFFKCGKQNKSIQVKSCSNKISKLIFLFVITLFTLSTFSQVKATPENSFENQVRQIVSEEVSKAFEKYSFNSDKTLNPEELSNTIIPAITEQVVKRSLPLVVKGSQETPGQSSTGSEITLLEIENKKITLTDLVDEYMKLPQRSRTHFTSVEKIKEFLNDVVLVNSLVIMESEKKKLRDREEVKVQLEKAYDNLLIETFYKQKKDEAAKKTSVTPQEISDFYEKNKSERYQIKDCIKLANIFIKFQPNDSESIQLARDKITKAKMELDMGAEFEKVWKNYSDDHEHENGVIGIFKKESYIKNAIIGEAFSRNKGEYTNIIKGNNGFYILKVLEKNDSKTISLADVRSMIESELKVKKENEYISKWLEDTKTRHNIKIYKEKLQADGDTSEIANTPQNVPGENGSEKKLQSKSESTNTEAVNSSSDEKDKEKNGTSKKSNGKKSKAKSKSKKSSKDKSEKTAAKSDKNSESPKTPGFGSAVPNVITTQDLNEVLAEVDGIKITRLQYNESIAQIPASHIKDLNRFSEKLSIVDKLINRIIFKKEALLGQTASTPEFIKSFSEMENKILARALIFEEVNKNIEPSAEDIKAYFEKNNKEYQARHILVAVKNPNDQVEIETAKNRAMTIYSKVTASNFAQIAQQFSDDVSKSEGGLLPNFTYADMVEAFSETVKNMKPGEISKPVLTQFGYHIILLENYQTLSLNESKGKIKEKLIPALQKKMLLDYIEQLKKKYKYKFHEDKIKYIFDNKLIQY